jgi:U4/U6.U5 tri-snRNP-associated protein 2
MSEESPSTQSLKRKAPESSSSSSTLYLETISRPLLDFDFELVCSVSNAKHAVYACLVCGKYFAGRGPNSVAYKHSIHADHHVFINLGDAKVYILPDNYEVKMRERLTAKRLLILL